MQDGRELCGELDGAPALVIVQPGSAEERRVPVRDRLFIGRDVFGVADERKLVIDDPGISRQHVEIRIDTSRGQAQVIDMSTNGTRLNGIRIERAVPVSLKAGDRLRLGDIELLFESPTIRDSGAVDLRATVPDIHAVPMVLVVADIVDFSTAAERVGSDVLSQTLDSVFSDLRALLRIYGGTVSNFAGDAFFAVWDVDAAARVCETAVEFALAARARMQETAPGLPVRMPGGGPLRLGWGIALGDATASAMTGALVTVVGDAANVAFRLSTLAGRDGRPDILVSKSVVEAAGARCDFVAQGDIELKGRTRPETVFGLLEPQSVPPVSQLRSR
jgi:class 3 adenylate cyclase